MVTSSLKTYTFDDGSIQKVQTVRFDDWNALNFFHPEYSFESFAAFCNVYRTYMVPAAPWIFGQMILFHLPKGCTIEIPEPPSTYGKLYHPTTKAAAVLKEGVRIINGKPVFKTAKARRFYEELEKSGLVEIVCGSLPSTIIIPIGPETGFLSQTKADAQLKVNANFFIFDRFDCSTIYDVEGTPFGLRVKDGMVEAPPLFDREAFLVHKDGSIEVKPLHLKDLSFEIGSVLYKDGAIIEDGKPSSVYSRPDRKLTPYRKDDDYLDLIIIGSKVMAIHKASRTQIPSSGFVLRIPATDRIHVGDPVVYHGLEDIIFGIQTGNSIMVNGEKTLEFKTKFYNIRIPGTISYPPCLYPLDFDNARAARIALGADKDGKGMLLWMEGPSKLIYTKGEHSRGASLLDMANICADQGMYNGLNLDGGGSSQILLHNERSLMISDRHPEDNTESERGVPIGLIIE